MVCLMLLTQRTLPTAGAARAGGAGGAHEGGAGPGKHAGSGEKQSQPRGVARKVHQSVVVLPTPCCRRCCCMTPPPLTHTRAQMEHQQRVLGVWRKYNCNPAKSLIGMVVQAPLFIGFFSALRGFATHKVRAAMRRWWLLLLRRRCVGNEWRVLLPSFCTWRTKPSRNCPSRCCCIMPRTAPPAAALADRGRRPVVHRPHRGGPHLRPAPAGQPVLPGDHRARRGRRHGGAGELAAVLGWREAGWLSGSRAATLPSLSPIP